MKRPAIKLKDKQERLREKEEKYANTLKKANSAKTKKEPKRKDINFLLSQITNELDTSFAIRPISTYPNRSYNVEKQIEGLIRHLYVKYPVPDFLYNVCRDDYKALDQHAQSRKDYLMWFLALAQGRSFPKLAKPYMTSKECYFFLSAPYKNSVRHNIWWAKLKAAGIPNNIAEILVERIFIVIRTPEYKNEGKEDLILFYARNHQDMDKTTLGEVNDYIAWLLRNQPDFSFKGRTAASMINLSNEWHRLMQKAKLGKHIEWKDMGIPYWEYVGKGTMWTMEELTNNKELANEGRKQKHCVYGYVSYCSAGSCNIFSLREYGKSFSGQDEDGNPRYTPVGELNRITVEIRNRAAVQIRGHLNRQILPHEKTILRMWAGEKGIRL